MVQLETEDIQGIILRGYPALEAANYLLLKINNNAGAKQWLKVITGRITPGHIRPQHTAVQIAFTFEGLKQLGLKRETLDTFPLELEDGMTTPHKQLFLGDFGNNDPDKWEWGGRNNDVVHILVMLYAIDPAAMDNLYGEMKKQFEEHGLTEIKRLDTSVLSQRKEHFGFRDGIAQPTIEGLERKDSPENTVAAGEFILGYKNSYGQYTDIPWIPDETNAVKTLPASVVTPGTLDLGRNGSYLIFRQLKQDVLLFWNYMNEATAVDGTSKNNDMIRLASKMVGRWPSGAPVTVCPEMDNTDMKDKDDFGYHQSDHEGLKCPVGSHVRRTNPRDTLDMDKDASVHIVNKHRLLRRGRSYGKPVCESLAPEDMLKVQHAEGERGLHFICFNADISRQFEFVQNAWVNNPKFANFYDERDPVIGNHNNPYDKKKLGTFSLPQNGLRKRYNNIPEFVTTTGGAYFFMPGIKALHYLSSI